VRAGERARERRRRAVAGRRGGLGRRGGAGAQLPRGALEQEPAPQRDGRLAGGGREQAVEVVAREVRSPGQRAAVGVRLVERLEHEVDQVAQAVRHAAHPRLIGFDMSLDAVRVLRHGVAHGQLVRLRSSRA
jgi:hypothetical protein